MTLFADVVAASDVVAATSARNAKVATLADLLGRLDADEVPVAVAMLVGEPRQGRTGVGWATLSKTLDDGPTEGDPLLVLDVDAAIDEIAAATGEGSVGARQAHLAAVLRRATDRERDFLRALLTGGLRQGALAGVMTAAIAKAAGVPVAVVQRAAMLQGDLGATAAIALGGGGPALAAVGLEVLRPVLPMLASTSATAGEAISTLGEASVEWKLDGARVQVHRDGERVRIFTRNLNDITDRLPGLVRVAGELPVDRVILDGEMLGLDPDERPERFQDTMSRFSQADGLASVALSVRFFDVLHCDGHDLIDQPLAERLVVLDRVCGPLAVPRVVTDDPLIAGACSDDVVALGHEGVVVKAIASTYAAGRRGGEWRKVKPVLTLDLVVLAAEWGHGRRRGWLSNLHLGARGADGGFVMVGKTFKGLTDALLTWQTERFRGLETRTDGHVVWIRPELVVEIALDGVQASRRYPGGVALRFARVKGYRADKSAAEADTIESVQALLR